MFPQHVAVQISSTPNLCSHQIQLTLTNEKCENQCTWSMWLTKSLNFQICAPTKYTYVCFHSMWFFKSLQLLNLCSHQIHLTHHLHLKIIYEKNLDSKIVFKTACGCSNLFNFWICPHFKNFTKFWISRPETLQTYGIFCHHNASKTQIWDVLFTTSSLLFIVIWQCL